MAPVRAASRSASGRWSGCECVTSTTPTVAPASRLSIAARWRSSSGPGSITTTTGPASTIQVLVPGPVYGPGFGATTRRTAATTASGGRAGRCRRRRRGSRRASRRGACRRSAGSAARPSRARRAAAAGPRRVDAAPSTTTPIGSAVDGQTRPAQPVLGARERLDQRGLRAEHRRLGGQRAGGAGQGEVQHRAEHDSACAVLRLRPRRLPARPRAGRPPAPARTRSRAARAGRTPPAAPTPAARATAERSLWPSRPSR